VRPGIWSPDSHADLAELASRDRIDPDLIGPEPEDVDLAKQRLSV